MTKRRLAIQALLAVPCSAVLGGGAAAQLAEARMPSVVQPWPPTLGIPVAKVWVVDDGGGAGVDFVELEPAVAAAATGDVLLVRDGFYESFTINGKSLFVVAEDGDTVAVNYTTEVRNLAPEELVVLRGLILGPTSEALWTRNSAGTVWVSDCSIQGDDTFGQSGPKLGLRVENCASVVLDGCVVSSPDEPFGEDGFVASQSSLVLWDTSVTGGLPDGPATPGGTGCVVSGGVLFASGCTFRGGTGGFGGDWGPPECFDGGMGGSGLRLVGASATLRDCASVGGGGGSALGTACADGPPGPGIDADGGTTLTTLAAAARTCDLPRVLREGTLAHFALTGEPGEGVTVYLGVGAAPTEVPGLAGVVVPRGPLVRVGQSVIGPNGTGSLPFRVPAPPPGADAWVLTGQAVFLAAEGPVLGSPFVSVVLRQGL